MTTRTLLLSALAAAAILSCSPAEKPNITVVPYPNEVEVKAGTFNAAGAAFHCSADIDEGSMNLINGFAGQLSLVSGQESTVDNNPASDGFNFSVDASLPKEAYTLTVSKKGVDVKASALNGFNYAIQTLKQMLPAEIYGKAAAADKEWTLQCVEIRIYALFPHFVHHAAFSAFFKDVHM